MGIAKLIIQLFADEELEPTNLEVEEEELEETLDFTDNEEESTIPVEEETTEEPEKVKMFTQDEVDNMLKNRLKRERNRLDREYKERISKYEELAYLTQEGLQAENFEDTLNKSRDFYGKKGIKYIPKQNTEEDEIIAKYRANEIIEEAEGIEEIQSTIDNLLSKGINMTSKEKLITEKLISELDNRKRLTELKTIGVKEEIYNSSEFKEFEKRFTKDTPISDVYDLYKAKYLIPKKEISNPGSMRTTPSTEKKTFISEAEYDKMTEKEIENNMDLIMESMKKW